MYLFPFFSSSPRLRVCLNCHSSLHNTEHTRARTHAGASRMITVLHITGRQITAGLPIHCNPSNTLNFHFKQRLQRQKTQASVLSPLLFLRLFFFSFFLFFPSSSSSSRRRGFYSCFFGFFAAGLISIPRLSISRRSVPTTCARHRRH